MPALMDVHTTGDSLARRDVAHTQVHAAKVGGSHHVHHRVHYLRYWVDEARGKVFCLVDAPAAGAPAGVHHRAYSLLAKEISSGSAPPERFDVAEIYRVQDTE